MTEHFSNADIQLRISAIAEDIEKDYAGRPVLILGVLKGCTVFLGHLLTKLSSLTVQVDFITLSSYRSGTVSKELQLVQDLSTSVKGKHVLIVEDIIDSGKTIAFLQNYLHEKKAATVRTAALVHKPLTKKHVFTGPEYVCFTYSDPEFLIGFGMDANEQYRNLPSLYKMPPT